MLLRQYPIYRKAERHFRRFVLDNSRPIDCGYVPKYLDFVEEALITSITNPRRGKLDKARNHLQEIAVNSENNAILLRITNLITQLNKKAIK